MKTKNNVQKAILRSVAVVVSFVLISFTVSAQDFWKRLLENSGFNEIALAMVDSKNDNENAGVTATSLKAMNLETEAEPSLQMETWMTDSEYFSVPGIQLIEETDAELELEEWMLNEDMFQSDDEEEPSLELEAWMVSDTLWKI